MYGAGVDTIRAIAQKLAIDEIHFSYGASNNALTSLVRRNLNSWTCLTDFKCKTVRERYLWHASGTNGLCTIPLQDGCKLWQIHEWGCFSYQAQASRYGIFCFKIEVIYYQSFRIGQGPINKLHTLTFPFTSGVWMMVLCSLLFVPFFLFLSNSLGHYRYGCKILKQHRLFFWAVSFFQDEISAYAQHHSWRSLFRGNARPSLVGQAQGEVFIHGQLYVAGHGLPPDLCIQVKCNHFVKLNIMGFSYKKTMKHWFERSTLLACLVSVEYEKPLDSFQDLLDRDILVPIANSKSKLSPWRISRIIFKKMF